MVSRKQLAERIQQLVKQHINIDRDVHINADGQVTNWKQLSPQTKEDYLEDTYEDIDYRHSIYVYPACRLLQGLGWKHLAGLNNIARKQIK